MNPEAPRHKKTRVLIVEDSRVVREFLEYIIGRDPRLEVAGSVGSAEEALRLLNPASPRAIFPDVISMDIRLPGMNGFEATQRIMSECPTPIVVVSASVESTDLRITMNALRAGALTVLEKPVGVTSDDYEALASRLCTQLEIMSKVKVIRRHAGPSSGPDSALSAEFFSESVLQPEAARDHGREDRRNARPSSRPALAVQRDFRVLGIVSSTGGPNALLQVFSRLGPDFSLPIVLVQHITSSFLEGFANWLGNICPFRVTIVDDRVRLEPGSVYIPRRDHHLRVVKGPGDAYGHGYGQVDAGDPVCGQRPSGNVLFESMANTLGGQALGTLLTGMGEDGAAGLLRLRANGGYTIAEDESTAVVYGMPAEAVRLGAVCESLPLPSIAQRILQLTAVQKEVA